MNKRHYEHTLPNIRGSLSNTYLEWTYPTTLLEEWDSNGYFDEIEGWYDSND